MAKATSSELYERQRALRQRPAVVEAELLQLAGPEDGGDLAWCIECGQECGHRAAEEEERELEQLALFATVA